VAGKTAPSVRAQRGVTSEIHARGPAAGLAARARAGRLPAIPNPFPMKKKFLIIVGGLLALLLVVFIGLEFFLGSIVTAGVNSLGPKLTGTKVELAGAHISPLTGSGTLTGLTVGNPAGWSSGNAFSLGEVHISLRPLSLFGNHIVIDEIIIDQPEFLYETKFVSSNIGDLLKQIEEATGGKKSTEPAAKNGQPLKLEIRHFKLTRGKVTVGVGPTAVPLLMPPIELNDLGTKEGGITPGQLTVAVMTSVTGGIIDATRDAAGKIGSTMGAAAGDTAKKAGESIKKFFGGGKK
jgi:hypothetical protein